MEAGAPAREEEECACCQCRPQLFTSVMLGALACVLVTGGVFLAFHKWDQMWLLVSAVGVVLIVVGTTLHCCSSSSSSQQQQHHGSHKTRPHVIPSGDNGLTEHLLPLSNARSVSQLSLNMVPSYFPAYTIEQHSAVVQNINRIMQSNGKSFLLLPIPGDTNSAQLQSLVATVYHLDGSTSTTEESSTSRETQAADMSSQSTEVPLCPAEQQPQPPTPNTSSTAVEPSSSLSFAPAVKHAEVQTCSDWQALQQNGPGSESSGKSTTTVTNTEPAGASRETVTASHCSPLEDNAERAECEGNGQCITEQHQTSSDAVEAVETVFTVSPRSTVCGTDDQVIQTECSPATVTDVVDDDVVDTLPGVSEIPRVLSDPSQMSSEAENNPSCSIPEVPAEASSTFEMMHTVIMADASDQQEPPTQHTDFELSFGDEHSENILMESEEAELFSRSSPPPSYEEVTQENQVTIGAFGLAYGTI